MDYLSKDKQVFLGSRIPLKKYRGITVLLEMEIAQQTLDQGFQQAHISLEQIRERLCTDSRSLIIKSKHEIDHIFSELYSVDERIQVPYFWIKVIELLLFLSLLDGSAVRRPQQFSADISKRTQEVYQYIIENPFTKDTIQDLACMFGLAESSLKMLQIYCWGLHRHLCQDETHGGRCRNAGFRADFEHWGDWKCGGI